MKRILAFAAAAIAVAGTAAADFMPAVIFDMGGKFDKSFNESAYNGAERFKAETGVEYLEFEITDPSQREGALRQMAELGANPIVVMGFAQADAMAVVAAEFPASASWTLVGWVATTFASTPTKSTKAPSWLALWLQWLRRAVRYPS